MKRGLPIIHAESSLCTAHVNLLCIVPILSIVSCLWRAAYPSFMQTLGLIERFCQVSGNCEYVPKMQATNTMLVHTSAQPPAGALYTIEFYSVHWVLVKEGWPSLPVEPLDNFASQNTLKRIWSFFGSNFVNLVDWWPPTTLMSQIWLHVDVYLAGIYH